MKSSRSLTNSVILALLFFLILARDAHAYIDPGTGSYILQLIIAGLVGLLFAVKVYWKKIKAFFSNLFLKKQEQKDDDE